MVSRRQPLEDSLEFCTIIAQNYLAFARVLASSVAEHHPGVKVNVLVIDDDGTIARVDPSYHVVAPAELDIDPVDYRRMAAIYDVTEMSTAVKPWLLRLLLDRGASEVVYLDPDIRVFTALDDLGALAREHRIVLTPHRLTPAPRDGRSPSEETLLQCGIYNLGFIAVNTEARPFLDWWAERLRRHCIRSLSEGLFVDQKWVDFVPALFGAHILRDPTLNIAYWNLDERPLVKSADQYGVDGSPLRFFHFSGFDPAVPHVLSKRAKDPRVLLSEHPGAAAICREYADALAKQGHDEFDRIPYGFGRSASGLELQLLTRRLYRKELLDAERDGRADEVPDPFDTSQGNAFVDWLNTPSRDTPDRRISRYLQALYLERLSLQKNFPRLDRADSDRYLAWIRSKGVTNAKVPPELVPSEEQVQAAPSKSTMRAARSPATSGGVNIAGYFRAESGVGEQARLLIKTLEAAGIAYRVETLTEAVNRQDARFEHRGSDAVLYDTTIVCVNADGTSGFVQGVGKELAKNTYTIGYWAWEIEHLPERMRDAAKLLDEVWGDSNHTATAIRSFVDTPVFAVAPPIVPPPVTTFTRSEVGLPEGFVFLFCFDFLSVMERKNPLGLIEAFSRAFEPGEGPTLVIKTVAGRQKLADLEKLRLVAASRPDILVIDGYMESERHHALTQLSDAYVSLHRAEGFGLTIAEAMAVGTPVIATAYSGNMDFMTEDNTYCVPYRMELIPAGCEPYPEGELWAAPDLEEAARLMRLVYQDPIAARGRADRARDDISAFHSPRVRSELIRERLSASRRSLASRQPTTESTSRRATPVRRFARLVVPRRMRLWLRNALRSVRATRRSPREESSRG